MSRYLLATLLCIGACDRGEPPKGPSSTAATSSPSSAPHRRRVQPRRAAGPSRPTPAPDAATAPDGGADAATDGSVEAISEPGLNPPPLIGADGKPLPQTEAPPQQSPWFDAGVRALFRAIQNDDPKLAEAFFFPLAAYEQVKDVKDPKRDWERRLIANFRRDIHDYHRRLGPKPTEARFSGIDLPKERTKWMKPRSEGNKLGYFRVTHSRLRYQKADGAPATLDVTSLISWRGEWYLVHLNGFQ
ncbi:MAG: hypothetical protein IT375_35250 [Polyangiaceae bacterium]|nr:hypothetical protein [Polyangiaceae bacterium]